MSADVITLPNVLAQRIRGAYERTERGRQEWIEGTLELAAALAEAREGFPSNAAFAAWLGQNELDWIGRDDRAALIGMAGDLSLARSVLQETRRTSWQMIWREEIQPHVRSATNMAAQEGAVAEKVQSAPSLPEKPESDPVNTHENPKEPPATPAVPEAKVSKHNALHDKPRVGEVWAVFQEHKARAALVKATKGNGKAASEIWSLILTAIDHGFARPSTAAVNTDAFPARMLFTGSPSRGALNKLDLNNKRDREQVRDVIMPAAVACRDAIIAQPDKIESILAEHAQHRQHEAQERAAKRRLDDAVKAMAPEQREVIMYGERLWPRVEHRFGTYEYDQLCAAIWYFRDLNNWFEGRTHDNSPRSRAILIRLSTRWPQEYVDRACDGESRARIKKVYSLVHTLARLMEDNPSGNCITPPTPNVEGQW